ncbi:MAG: GNAT family N-acetyltransferase [Hyphomicrobiaceae bacterium]
MLTFRLATIADAAVVAELIDAMDAHYRDDGNTRGVVAAILMVEETIRAREGTRFLLAFDRDAAVGLACFAILRPGYRHEGLLFLKDLFVPAALRQRGIGRALMRELAAFAIAHDIGRIDLTTDTDNVFARALYASLGGSPQDKVMFRYDGAALKALARRN